MRVELTRSNDENLIFTSQSVTDANVIVFICYIRRRHKMNRSV